jgi:colanic acid biosynthesis glycosyl transferase WcaI
MTVVVPNRQHVWVVSELYYPELTSTGYFLTGIAEGLALDYRVSVLCAQPSYGARGVMAPSRETIQGVEVRRCWSTTFDKNKLLFRIANLITISLSVFWAALFRFHRGDIVIAVTNPPLLPYLMVLACRVKGARFVLLVHDVYPEVFTKIGILKPESPAVRVLDRASRWLYNTADCIIVLGRDMQQHVVKKLTAIRNQVLIASNWGDIETIYPQPLGTNRLLKNLGLTDKFVVQYCGNIGRTHGIEDLIDSAELLLEQRQIHFVLIGWGAKKRWACEQQEIRKLENLTILNPLPSQDLCDGLNACNVALVSFSKGMAGISVPSRLYNILAAGKPLLAVCDIDSELATVVKEEGIGWVIPPGRPDLVVSALQEAKGDLSVLRSMGERARKAAETKYTSKHVLEVYKTLIESLRSE